MNKQEDDFHRKVHRDLLFTEAGNFRDCISIKDIAHDELKPAWYAFQQSIESARLMVLLPQVVVTSVVDHLVPLTQAIFNVLKKPVLDDSELSLHVSEIGAELTRIRRGFFDDRPKVRAMLLHELVIYNKFNLVNFEGTRPGFVALLEAQVIAAWSAFDTLTTDLCVAAVNTKPKLLEKMGQREAALNDILNAIGSNGWSGRPGEIIRAFVRFDSFNGTKDAYKKLFANPAINDALSSKEAGLANLLRNQIAHEAGNVSENFIRRAKTYNAEPWMSATIGERLPLDGKNVAGLAGGIVQCANDLIRAVDNWLQVPPAEIAAR